MKTKLLCLGVLALSCVGALLSGCADNIGSYTSATVSPVDKVVYYIAGTVSDPDGQPVSAATVVSGSVTTSTDSVGRYQLTIAKTGSHTVLFGLDGYISMSVDVTIPSDAGAYSEVPLSAILYPTALTTVTPSSIDTTYVVSGPAGTQAEAGGTPDVDLPTYLSTIGLIIPPGAVSKQLTISYFAPAEAAINATAGSADLPLAAINISPDVSSFNNSAKVQITATNPLGDAAFSIVQLYNSDSKATIATTYDSVSNAYTASISHFSSWLFTLPTTVTFATGDTLTTIDIDNSGSEVSLRNREVTYTVTSGWTLLSISDSDVTESLTALLTNYKGCAPGITQQSRTRQVNVTAGGILRMSCTQNFRTETYTFTLSDSTKVTATVKQYLDLSTAYIYVGHSGGSGS